ncbi:unnamed protein product, partial [Didymodactylos carnosus]
NTDTEYLVYGILRILMEHPQIFAYIPQKAFDITMKSIKSKLGHADVETITNLIVLSLERAEKPLQITPVVTQEITDALDDFFLEEPELSVSTQ